MPTDPVNIAAGIFIAIIAALGGWLAQRAAARGQKYNADAIERNAKLALEAEAYARARAIDMTTIKWQDEEILDIRKENGILRQRLREVEIDNEELRRENVSLRRRVSALEEKKEDHNDEQGV